MLDNQLFTLIRQTIINQEAVVGLSGTAVKQAFQPTQQGVNTSPTAYIYKVSDKRYGFPKFEDVWDPIAEQMAETTTQIYETTFQISVLSTQDPATPDQLTASDVLNFIAYILQSSTTIAIFEAQGVGILRVMEVRNPNFTDDRQRNEASPSFDFVLTHKQIITTTTPPIDTVDLNVSTV